MKLLFTFLFSTIVFGKGVLAQHAKSDFAGLRGLEGTWKMTLKNGSLFEKWLIESDSILQGISYKISGPDSIPLEKVVLHFNNGKVTYTAITANQNKQQPVDFTLVSIKNGQYVFENKAHDFPQQVTYELVGRDSLYATINGTTDKGFKEITYPYSRIQAAQ